MLQPCGQGSCRAVGNLLLLEAGRDDKCCILTCCDLNIFPCLYFQNGNQYWVVTGLSGFSRLDFSQSSRLSEPGEGAENRGFPYYTPAPHFC